MRESNVLRSIWLALGRTTTLFRLNTGRAWLSGAGPAQRRPDGSVIVPAARPVALGFGKPDGTPLAGASDLVGWTTIEVTPSMVGRTVAIFTAIECKRTERGRTSDDQKNFVAQVTKAGGIAGVANTPEVGQSIIADWLHARGVPHQGNH